MMGSDGCRTVSLNSVSRLAERAQSSGGKPVRADEALRLCGQAVDKDWCPSSLT